MGGLQVELLAIDLDVLPDPFDAHRFDFRYLQQADLGLVRKVEAKFSWCNQRALLVDVVSEDFAQTEVEDVGRSVVVAQRPTPELKSYEQGVSRPLSILTSS